MKKMVSQQFWALIFQTMNCVRSNSLCLKHQRFILSGCKDKGISKFKSCKRSSRKNYDYHMNDVIRLYYIILHYKYNTIKVEGFF